MQKPVELENKQQVEHNHFVILASFAVIFYVWGLLTNINFSLVDQLSFIFGLSYSLGLLINLTFFFAYLLFSIPAGGLIKRAGYKKAILYGWISAAAGCFLVYFSITERVYWLFLAGILAMAGGITILQVGANLYIVLYGEKKTGASRLNLVQAFNSVGAFISASFGSLVIWSFVDASEAKQWVMDKPEARVAIEAAAVNYPYLIIGVLMVLYAIYLSRLHIPHIHTEKLEPLNKITSLRRRHVMHFPQLRLGAFAIFAYVGAEVALGQYLHDKASAEMYFMNFTKVDIYWGLMLVGRILAAIYLMKIRPRRAVGYSALIAAFLVTFSLFTMGVELSGVRIDFWAITMIGICNSLLFPTIFSLGLSGLGKFSIDGSAVMIMFIVGGAVIPFMVRNFSHAQNGYYIALIIPIVCYLYISLYGFRLSRYEKEESVLKKHGETYEKLEIG